MNRTLATIIAMAASVSITLALVSITLVIALESDIGPGAVMFGLVVSILLGMVARFGLRDWVARHAVEKSPEKIPTARLVK